jgi:hypothetical protein
MAYVKQKIPTYTVNIISPREYCMGVTLKEFFEGMHEGVVITDLIKGLLQKSGYSVFLNGYEERFSEIKECLNDNAVKNSRTVRMIRSSPDLIVYDKGKKDVLLAEVKMRRAHNEKSVWLYDKLEKMANYREFWRDAILVIVIPIGQVFYAQKFSELEVKNSYNAETDFRRFEDFFSDVNQDDLADFKEKAKKAMIKTP